VAAAAACGRSQQNRQRPGSELSTATPWRGQTDDLEPGCASTAGVVRRFAESEAGVMRGLVRVADGSTARTNCLSNSIVLDPARDACALDARTPRGRGGFRRGAPNL